MASSTAVVQADSIIARLREDTVVDDTTFECPTKALRQYLITLLDEGETARRERDQALEVAMNAQNYAVKLSAERPLHSRGAEDGVSQRKIQVDIPPGGMSEKEDRIPEEYRADPRTLAGRILEWLRGCTETEQEWVLVRDIYLLYNSRGTNDHITEALGILEGKGLIQRTGVNRERCYAVKQPTAVSGKKEPSGEDVLVFAEQYFRCLRDAGKAREEYEFWSKHSIEQGAVAAIGWAKTVRDLRNAEAALVASVGSK